MTVGEHLAAMLPGKTDSWCFILPNLRQIILELSFFGFGYCYAQGVTVLHQPRTPPLSVGGALCRLRRGTRRRF